MPISVRTRFHGIAFVLLLAIPAACWAQEPIAAEATATAGDGTPFSYHIALRAEKDAFRVYTLNYPSPVHTAVDANNTVPAELYLPKDIRSGSPRRPAVICLHILDGNVELVQIACSAMAARGIPAAWFHLPYYGPRAGVGGRKEMTADPALFAAAISQSIEDVRRTVDVLASRPEIDPKSVGVLGISLGGILAATAAENDPRIARAALLLTGGDLLPVIYQSRETRELGATLGRLTPEGKAGVERAIRAADPLTHADRLRARAQAGKVLMINAARDEVIPRACTEKLATALGIADGVVWLDGLGHYTAMAELPRTLQTAVDFFAQDLPAGVKPTAPAATASPQQALADLLAGCRNLMATEPQDGRCHVVDIEAAATSPSGKKYAGRLRMLRGPRPKFSISCQLPGVGEVSLGNGAYPWMAAGRKIVFKGKAASPIDPLAALDAKNLVKLQMAGGVLGAAAMAPDVLDRWISTVAETSGDLPAVRIVRKDRPEQFVRIALAPDRLAPRSAAFAVEGYHGTITFHAWQCNALANDAMFQEPAGVPVQEVPAADLGRMFAAALTFALEAFDKPGKPAAGKGMEVVARDPAGHGMLCCSQGKTILMVSGSPAEMGAAHGRLLHDAIGKLCERVLYLVGAGDSLRTGVWAFDRFAEIERRAGPHLPPRYLAECDAMSRAAGVSLRDGRAANLFPERFHCSGVALCGKATADGRVLHARVLDYMRDIRLQDAATVTVFMPTGRNRWVNLGYGGFIGTVTAMNEKGLAVGEMGGRGEGDWDGMPMSFLLREVMERASTVDEALDLLRRTPRTCEYYYVLSDKSRAMAAVYCTPREITILRPGEQHPLLPRVPDDTVLVSAGDRAKTLSERLLKDYGKIDAARLIEIIKRPVAMQSNLHDAVFSPETLEFWIADAGRLTPACDEPYAKFKLEELIGLYEKRD